MGVVSITRPLIKIQPKSIDIDTKRKTWSRKKNGGKSKKVKGKPLEGIKKNRHLVDVMITEGSLEDMDCEELKRRGLRR